MNYPLTQRYAVKKTVYIKYETNKNIIKNEYILFALVVFI
jgi:hypothetical protein